MLFVNALFVWDANFSKLSLFTRDLQQIVVNQFSRVCHHERCSFFGHVSLGSSISLPELRNLYHVVTFTLDHDVISQQLDFIFYNWLVWSLIEQVVLAYGAESDRSLGIPGEVRNDKWYYVTFRDSVLDISIYLPYLC